MRGISSPLRGEMAFDFRTRKPHSHHPTNGVSGDDRSGVEWSGVEKTKSEERSGKIVVLLISFLPFPPLPRLFFFGIYINMFFFLLYGDNIFFVTPGNYLVSPVFQALGEPARDCRRMR